MIRNSFNYNRKSFSVRACRAFAPSPLFFPNRSFAPPPFTCRHPSAPRPAATAIGRYRFSPLHRPPPPSSAPAAAAPLLHADSPTPKSLPSAPVLAKICSSCRRCSISSATDSIGRGTPHGAAPSGRRCLVGIGPQEARIEEHVTRGVARDKLKGEAAIIHGRRREHEHLLPSSFSVRLP
jgi:hypothetical protein